MRVNIEYGSQTNNQLKVTDENGQLVLCQNVSFEIRHGHLMAFLLGFDRVSHPHRVGLVNVVLPDGTTFVRTQEQVDDEIRRAVSGEMELYAFTIASPPSIPNANGRIYPAHDTYKFGDKPCGINSAVETTHGVKPPQPTGLPKVNQEAVNRAAELARQHGVKQFTYEVPNASEMTYPVTYKSGNTGCGYYWTKETHYEDGSRSSRRMFTPSPFYDKQLGEPFEPTPRSKPDHDPAADAYGNRVPMAKVPVPQLPAKGWHSELVALCQSLTDGDSIGVGDEPQAESVREWCRKLGRPDLKVVTSDWWRQIRDAENQPTGSTP